MDAAANGPRIGGGEQGEDQAQSGKPAKNQKKEKLKKEALVRRAASCVQLDTHTPKVFANCLARSLALDLSCVAPALHTLPEQREK